MARPNYGAIPTTSSAAETGSFSAVGDRTEFNQLSETISSNLFSIQSSGSNLERALKSLGTSRDNQGLRDRIHVIQMSAKQIINQTSQELMLLSSAAQKTVDKRQRSMLILQAGKLKDEFGKSLQRYSSLQKEVAGKMKSNLSYSKLEGMDDSQTSSDLLEKIAEERHQKLQELKQAEFDQQMLLERERRINQIESDMIDVNQIMKELSAMVQEQGETINSIENNIDLTHGNVESAVRQLDKASSYQRTHRKCLCFLVGLVLTVAIVVALILYFELRPSN